MRRKVRVKVPASTANLGPGFDTLGMALNLYVWVEMGIAERETQIRLFGDQMAGVPTDKSNLVYQVAQMIFREAGVDHPELDISVYSEIPTTRGLGSSASAIIGGMAAANALIGHPFSTDDLFQMATRLEGHPDNVGASLFGGIVAAAWDGSRAEVIRIEPDQRLEVLAAIPEFHLPTEQARNVLPQQVPLSDAVFNVSRSSLLVAALMSGRLDLLGVAMRDALHQPYREELIPGMKDILAGAADRGALGIALSGAGPTLLAFIESGSERLSELERFLLGTFSERNVRASVMRLKPCPQGAELLTVPEESSTFIQTIKGEVRA
jgi:homoserine kinase